MDKHIRFHKGRALARFCERYHYLRAGGDQRGLALTLAHSFVSEYYVDEVSKYVAVVLAKAGL